MKQRKVSEVPSAKSNNYNKSMATLYNRFPLSAVFAISAFLFRHEKNYRWYIEILKFHLVGRH
jgi:hypothetical protein